jgi:hypothetical protein
MKIGIPMLVKGLSMIASHVGDISRQPTKILSNVASVSTVVGAGLGSAAYIGGDELHSLIGAWDGASTDQMVAHVAVYVAQAVMGVVSVWAMAKKPGTKIGD